MIIIQFSKNREAWTRKLHNICNYVNNNIIWTKSQIYKIKRSFLKLLFCYIYISSVQIVAGFSMFGYTSRNRGKVGLVSSTLDIREASSVNIASSSYRKTETSNLPRCLYIKMILSPFCIKLLVLKLIVFPWITTIRTFRVW